MKILKRIKQKVLMLADAGAALAGEASAQVPCAAYSEHTKPAAQHNPLLFQQGSSFVYAPYPSSHGGGAHKPRLLHNKPVPQNNLGDAASETSQTSAAPRLPFPSSH